ncbi:MAG: pyridoxal phosphate-dependent aminotransferase [Betaproteobacteria bacterium]
MKAPATTVPRLAKRVDAIAPFRVMELVKRASALAAAGHRIIQMNIGEPDFTAPPAVVAALKRAADSGLSQYTSATGIVPLRRAIARDLGERYGVDVAPQRVIVTAGASAALLLAACALVEVGDRVLMTDPSYPCNRHFVSAFNGIPDPVPVGPETRFQMTRALLEAHWLADTRGALLASPSNPTGTSIDWNELRAIVDSIRARGGFSLIDEIYLGLSYGERPRSALELGEDVIICNSFSKLFSMTGWRLGWLVVPESMVPVFEKLAQNLFICASALAQHAALGCFEPESLAIFEDRRLELKSRRDFLVPALTAAGLDIPAIPDGAFYIWIDCARQASSSLDLADRLLDEAHVSLVPGHDFGTVNADRYLRLSYATARPLLEEAASRIKRFLAHA